MIGHRQGGDIPRGRPTRGRQTQQNLDRLLIAAEDPEDPENPWICPWQEQSSPLKPDPTSLSAITVDANGDTPGDKALIDQWGSGWQVTDMGKRIRTNLCTGDALTSL